jgi:hypothetical protein
MTLSSWCYLLGLVCVVLGGGAALAPAAVSRFYTALPRSRTAGYVLSAVAWAWAGYALWSMGLDFLEPFKRYIPLAVLVCIPLTWFWMENLLPCRAVGGLLTLFPYDLLHAARVHPSAGRLVVVSLAYLCIVAGMVLLLYPWKMRQATAWLAARPALFRLGGAAAALVGLALAALGASVLRG